MSIEENCESIHCCIAVGALAGRRIGEIVPELREAILPDKATASLSFMRLHNVSRLFLLPEH